MAVRWWRIRTGEAQLRDHTLRGCRSLRAVLMPVRTSVADWIRQKWVVTWYRCWALMVDLLVVVVGTCVGRRLRKWWGTTRYLYVFWAAMESCHWSPKIAIVILNPRHCALSSISYVILYIVLFRFNIYIRIYFFMLHYIYTNSLKEEKK